MSAPRADLRTGGVCDWDWTRLTATDFARVPGRRGNYRFAVWPNRLDEAEARAKECAAYRVTPLFILMPPADLESAADYGAEVGRRLSLYSTAFEIGNEPNGWKPYRDDAEGFAAVFEATRMGLVAAAPDAHVILGGLARTTGWETYLEDVIEYLSPYSLPDGLAFHPYGGNAYGTALLVQRFRRAAVALGLGALPIHLTEFGIESRDYGTGEVNTLPALAFQAEQIRRLIPFFWKLRFEHQAPIRTFCYFAWRDALNRADHGPNSYLGLRLMDDAPKPAWAMIDQLWDYTKIPAMVHPVVAPFLTL